MISSNILTFPLERTFMSQVFKLVIIEKKHSCIRIHIINIIIMINENVRIDEIRVSKL